MNFLKMTKESKLGEFKKALDEIFIRNRLRGIERKNLFNETEKKILFDEIKKKMDNFQFEKDSYQEVIKREMSLELLLIIESYCEMVSCEVLVDKDLTHLVFLGISGKAIALKKETDTEFPEEPERWAYKYLELFEPFFEWLSTDESKLKDPDWLWFSIEEILEEDLIFENK